jgi:soluble lytic murein transglycosylase-like protein
MHARVITFGAVVIALLLPAAAVADVPHVVEPGESLSSVAATDGLSVAALAAANGLSPFAELTVGQVLEIPPQTATATGQASGYSEATNTTESTSSSEYVSDSSPSESTSSTTESSTTTSSGSGPYPTDEHVSASEIAEIADANGVPAALAEAIGWQESGRNNDEISSADAVGVMQIVPSTWTWIDQNLTPDDPLGASSASENVRGGVLLLHELLSLTGDNYAETAAGYYQGLDSVKRYGMYPSTRQYVNDVLALEERLAG